MSFLSTRRDHTDPRAVFYGPFRIRLSEPLESTRGPFTFENLIELGEFHDANRDRLSVL